jgi:hypothetical protein
VSQRPDDCCAEGLGGTVQGAVTRCVPACALLVAAVALTGCSGSDGVSRAGSSDSASASDRASGATVSAGPGGSGAQPSRTPTSAPTGTPTGAAAYAVPDPGRLEGRLLTSDVLVTSSGPIPARVRRAVAGVRGVEGVLPMSLASLSLEGRTLAVAAADPGQFRRFTPFASARTDEVWSRVAGGEIAVDPSLPDRLADREGYLQLGTAADAPKVHIGAYAPMMQQSGSAVSPISAVVNVKRGRQLGLPSRNALLVSTGTRTPSAVKAALKGALGRTGTLQILAREFDMDAPATAVLSGSSVSDAVGTFSYTPNADGSVTPDPRWVSSYIRSESMPILGTVTGNKGMLPQLRAALDEVLARGLAGEIHAGEYGGCYVPRFIASDPSKGLSLHTWGMAVDLNVPGNLRGTSGEMDRRVVSIFKKWGFAWGGDWNYTDPMHFEMAKVVRVR